MKIRKLLELEYKEICGLLEIDPKSDLESTILLDKKLRKISTKKNLVCLKKKVKGKSVFIFGAGPSLNNALKETKQIISDFKKKVFVVAVDGATKALLEEEIKIDLVVSDLDGGINTLLASAQKYKPFLIIHAHGDNQDRISEFFSKTDFTKIIGSTQITDTDNVRNFGGFTDGDRAAYLAANMGAQNIFLFGFDFGNIIGRYSKPEEFTSDQPMNERKMIKLQIAKKLLSKIPNDFPKLQIYNASKTGGEIDNIKKINLEEIKSILQRD